MRKNNNHIKVASYVFKMGEGFDVMFKKIMKNHTALIYSLLIVCSGVGAVEKSDLDTKLEQANKMMQVDRPLMAVKLIGEALRGYRKNNNSLGIANAHYAYGNLYKSAVIQPYITIYDPTLKKSIKHFIKAKEWYIKEKNEMGVVKSLTGIGIAYAKKGDFKAACKNILESLQTYEAGKAKGIITSEHEILLPGHSDFGSVIIQLKKQANCNG